MERDFDRFWKAHQGSLERRQKPLSTEAKVFIQNILEVNPDNRFSIEDIRQDPWYNKEIFKGLECKVQLDRLKVQANDVQMYKAIRVLNKFTAESRALVQRSHRRRLEE